LLAGTDASRTAVFNNLTGIPVVKLKKMQTILNGPALAAGEAHFLLYLQRQAPVA
jgi:hypothetical protein